MKLLTAFFLLLVNNIGQAQPQKIVVDKIVATVADQIILQSDISNILQDNQRLNKGMAPLTECSSMEGLIMNKILLTQAEREDVKVTDEEVESQLKGTIDYYIRQLHGEAEFEKQAGKSIQSFKEDSRSLLKEKMLIDAMLSHITSKVKVTPSEVASYYNSIPLNARPFIEAKYSIDQLIYYPMPSKEMHEYVINELRNYKNQIIAKKMTFERLASLYSENKNAIYEIKRGDKGWDIGFLSSIFRLRENEVSEPLKSGNTYYLAKMQYREGDNVVVQLIAKTPLVNEYDIRKAVDHIDSVRSKVIAGTLSFNQAVATFSNDDETKYSISLVNENGEPRVSISQLDQEVVKALSSIQVGQISKPIQFRDREGREAVKIVYLRSKSNPHILSLTDDYVTIAKEALENKKQSVLKKWIESRKSYYSIVYDEEIYRNCIASTNK